MVARPTLRSSNSILNEGGRPWVNRLLLFFFSVIASGCISSEQLEFSKAEKAAQKSNFDVAMKHYQTMVEHYVHTPLALKSAKEAARISHYEQKKFKEAIGFYKHIVLYSPDETERVEAQKKIADIYFNQTLDYNQAIVEYSRLLDLPHSKEQEAHYRLAIARSYFYLSNSFQAQVEIDTILKEKPKGDLLFDALHLRANLLVSVKNFETAAEVFKRLIEEFPKRAGAENIGLALALCYEEQKNYVKAIETLETLKDSYPRKSFIENRIKSLKERQSYLPGARGWRK